MQNVTIIGHLGQNREVKQTANGRSYASFSLAVGYREKDESGEWVDKTNWWNVITFQEGLFKFLAKGVKVAVIGRMKAKGIISKRTGEPLPALDVMAMDLQVLKYPETHVTDAPESTALQLQDIPAAEAKDQDGDLPF